MPAPLSKHPLNDARFIEDVFAKTAKQKTDDPVQKVILDELVTVCKAMDGATLQQSTMFRAATLGRHLAVLLISEKGVRDKKRIFRALELLKEHRYSLGPKRFRDDPTADHVLATLEKLHTDTTVQQALDRITSPHKNTVADQLLKETLKLPMTATVSDADAKRAVLSALLTPIRQNVGSCFATAPAILIQQQNPRQCIDDMGQLIGIGMLKRVFEGKEYTVPLSISGGMADLFRSTYSSSLGKNPLKTLAAGPGLMAGFEGAGVIDPKLPKKRKIEIAFDLLEKSGLKNALKQPFVPLNADQIFKKVLRKYYKISEGDLNHYETSPAPTFSGIALQAPPTRGGKARACERYKKSYQAATAAFIAMTDNALLKAWEFTLASFSETKGEFAKWNLYSSLGLNAEEENGIGQCFHQFIQKKIDKVNDEIEEQQQRYDHLFAAAKSLESRYRGADTESSANWIQAEYQTRKMEIHRVLVLRDEAYERGQRLHALFPFLIEFYASKFKDYFQEVYDAKMRDVEVTIYDDTPAGFRLLYKHGRSNPALWTLIYNTTEYVQALCSFFIATEVELSQASQTKGLQSELTQLVTEAITLVKRSEFLEASLYRLARVYNEPIVKDPLKNLDRVKRKPWVYVSGGTVSTLIQTYFGALSKPKESSRWVESSRELLAFFIETVKELPLSVQKEFQSNKNSSLLAFSPTHAFLLKPGWPSFREGWESDIYPYTWIRNTYEHKGKAFLNATRLDTRMMERLRDEIAKAIPEGYRALFKTTLRSFAYTMTPHAFREQVVGLLSHERWVKQTNALPVLIEEIDSALYRLLPLFPEHQLKEVLKTLFEAIDEVDNLLIDALLSAYDKLEIFLKRYTLVSAADLRDIAKSLLMIVLKTTRTSIPLHQLITKAMQQCELAYPAPLLFADTNWVDNVFGFVVGPGTEELELWRFDPSGSTGKPMPIWRPYLDGTSKLPWGVYASPKEYTL